MHFVETLLFRHTLHTKTTEQMNLCFKGLLFTCSPDVFSSIYQHPGSGCVSAGGVTLACQVDLRSAVRFYPGQGLSVPAAANDVTGFD